MTADARHVLFRAGGERFALPLESVREVVVPHPPFARVPRAPPAVRGAMNLRGRVVAVVELAGLLGIPAGAEPPEQQSHLVILDRGRRGVGILVGAVLGVEALPAAPAAPPRASPLVRGVTVSEAHGAAVTVLDADELEARAAGLFGAA